MEKHELAARLRASTGKHDDVAAIQQHTIDALRERLAASEARYLDLRKRTPPDCTVENFTKMGAQLVVMSQRLAAAEAVVDLARQEDDVSFLLLDAIDAYDALAPKEKP